MKQILLFALLTLGLADAVAQCDHVVSGQFFYCRPENPDSFFVAFRIEGAPDTLHVIDLNGEVVANSGIWVDDIDADEEPKKMGSVDPNVSQDPIRLTASDPVEYRYFGPIPNGVNIDVVIIDVDNICDTIEVFSGVYDCNGTMSGGCSSVVPFYDIDFTNNPFDSFSVIQRSRIETCCDAGMSAHCFEFRVTLSDNLVGLIFEDIGSGSTGGELLADFAGSFSCTGSKATTWPFLQESGASAPTLCLVGGETYVIASCKPGGNTTGVTVAGLAGPRAPDLETPETCESTFSVQNADQVSWSSPQDPDLLNLNCPDPDSLTCTFHYDTIAFGVVTDCLGDTFYYIATVIPADVECIGDTAFSDTSRVVVYPVYELSIDTICHDHPDSVTLSAVIEGPASGCPYDYEWSNGMMGQSITILADNAMYSVTVTRSDITIDEACVPNTIGASAFNGISVSCNISDSVVTCRSLIPGSNSNQIEVLGCADNVAIYSVDRDLGGDGCVGDTLTVERTYYIDFDGNLLTFDDVDSCSQLFFVVDTNAALITCPSDTSVSCDTSTDPVFTGQATASDDCFVAVTDITYSDVVVSGGCPNSYTIQRSWVGADSCGNADTCVQLIAVVDTSAPILVCPPDTVILCDAATDTTALGAANASDNCQLGTIEVTYMDQVISGMCSGQYDIQRTWTATDSCGNSTTCIQNISVVDTLSPLLSCPPDTTIACGTSIDTSILGLATGTDNCAIDNSSISYMDSNVPTMCIGSYSINRVWSISDSCGNMATCLQVITVIDTSGPTITCPSDTIVDCAMSLNPNVLGWATANDNCDVVDSIGYSDAIIAGMCVSEMMIQRTWVAIDGCGNSSFCVQNIMVQDTSSPEIICPTDTTIDCSSSTDPVTTGMPIAMGNCVMMEMNFSYDDAIIPGMCAFSYTIQRTWTATDTCGNMSTCVQAIAIQDTTPPVISCPGDTTVSCESDIEPVALGTATAMDNCGMSVFSITSSDLRIDGSCDHSYTVQRTWVAVDSCGNSSMCIQEITIIDTTAPTLTIPSDTSLSCFEDYQNLAVSGTPFYSDNCDTLTLMWSDDLSALTGCNGTGSIVRTFSVEDDCGNLSSGQQMITLVDTAALRVLAPGSTNITCVEISTLGDIEFSGQVNADQLCGSIDTTYSDDLSNVVCGGTGIITRTWIISDTCGRIDSVEQAIVVSDLTCLGCRDTIIMLPGDTCFSSEIYELDEIERFEFCGNGVVTAVTHLGDSCVSVSLVNPNDPNLPGVDTTCMVFCDTIEGVEFCDTTIIITVIPPRPDTVIRFILGVGPDTLCLSDVLQWGIGYNATVECQDFDFLDYVIEENGGDSCILYSNNSAGVGIDTLTIKHCYDTLGFQVCDTTDLIIIARPPTDTLIGRLGPLDTTIYCFDTVLQFGPRYTSMIMCGPPSNVDDQLFPRMGIDTCLQVMTSDSFAGIDSICLLHCYPTPLDNIYDTTLVIVIVSPLADTIFVQPNTQFCLDIPIYELPEIDRVEICGFGNEATLNPINDRCYSFDAGPGFIGPDTACVILCDTIAGIELCDTTYIITQTCPDNIACNDLIHLTLGANCRATVTGDLILEGERGSIGDFVTITVKDENGQPHPNAFDGDDVGQIFTVHASLPGCGMACWGQVLIEDKHIPDLNCRDTVITVMCDEGTDPEDVGFPLDSGFTYTRVPGQDEFVVSGFDSCGDVWLSYSDQMVKNGCGAQYYTLITRSWHVVDAQGNETSCVEQIGVLPGSLDSVVFPRNHDGLDEFVLECDFREVVTKSQPIGGYNIGWNALSNGYPSPYDDVINVNDTLIGTGAPTGLACDHIVANYRDRIIETCGPNTYKLLRTWFVYDWCTGEDSTHLQVIKVVDTRAPQIICPSSDPIIVNTDPWECTGTYLVPDPIFDPNYSGGANVPVIIQECSNWTYEVKHKVASVGTTSPDQCADVDESATFFTTNVRQLPNGRWQIFDMPQGCNWLKYIITDDCGNTVECGLELFVADNQNPVAVCDEHTVVSLNDLGLAEVCAPVLDNGSLDNCTAEEDLVFEVKRMGESDNLFRDCIEFECDDVAQSPIMVVFRVYDEAGLFNDCMVEVSVQDKITPEITCPPDTIINCDQDYQDASVTGSPTVTDQCGNPQVTFEIIEENLNDCGVGYVIKRWRATDNGGRFDICDQRIDIIDSDMFDMDDIDWPDNYTVDGCQLIDAHPNVLPAGYDWPTYENEDCAKPVAGYDDQVFYDASGYCIKIFRQWEVIEWCQYTASNGNTGLWTHEQIIFVDNTEGPQIIAPSCDDREICVDGDCLGLLDFEVEATDDCTPSNDLSWVFEVVHSQSQNKVFEGLGNAFTYQVPIGEYDVTFKVKDDCGNETTCTSHVTLIDCKNPTPYCNPGIVTTIMPSTGFIDIWANDFDEGSFDNCTAQEDLRISFSSDTSDRSRRITCDSLSSQGRDTFDYQMWVTDEAGNQEYCTIQLIVQDNQNVCGGTSNLKVAVGGLIKTADDREIEDVVVDLMSNQNKMSEMMTEDDGLFAFYDLNQTEVYSVEPGRNDDHLNGVSTADLVTLQRHLLGKKELTSPYDFIAADANNSASISAGDLAELRRLILGLYNELPNNTSWRFVDANQTFDDNRNPWANGLNEKIEHNPIMTDMMDDDFIGIKVGDLNGDVVVNGVEANGTRSDVWIGLKTTDKFVDEGEWFEVPVMISEGESLLGIQFTLELSDAEGCILHSGQMKITDGHYHWNAEKGTLTFTWYNDEAQTFDTDEALFTLSAVSTKDQRLSGLVELTSTITKAEAYLSDLQPVGLRFQVEEAETPIARLYQNVPNPFSNSTTIGFDLSNDEMATIRVFSTDGRLVSEVVIFGKRGYNEITMEGRLLPTEGVYYYQLSSGDFVDTKKLILKE